MKAEFDRSIINHQFNPRNAAFLQHRAQAENQPNLGFPMLSQTAPRCVSGTGSSGKSSAETSK